MEKSFAKIALLALIVVTVTHQTIARGGQEAAVPAYDYDTLVNTFRTDKEKGTRMWIAHMTNMVTPDGYRARLTPESNPARMILEWIQDLYQGMEFAKAQLSISAETTAVLHNNYTDALLMNPASQVTRSAETYAPLTIVELREMIATHFMRIYHLIESNYSALSSDTNTEAYNDGLSKLLYGLCELSLQRWAEHSLSRATLTDLFEQQYQACSQIVPALRICYEKYQQSSMMPAQL